MAAATELDSIEKALNDDATKASTLWIAFITFALYLSLTIGSVTHRDIFLENPLKLPVLGTDLWPAPGSEDTELGVLLEPEVDHGEAEVYAGV
jgi:hypothetical protein